jgi:signal transduction histidine kinase
MSIKIAMIIALILQFITAILAMTLIKRTKTNIAWWLISAGLLFMAIRRMFELMDIYETGYKYTSGLLNSWLGVLTSFVMLLSLSFIKRIFNIQQRFDELKRKNEARVFSAIIRTEQNQRQKFSKELHDGLGPILSSVKMSISAINSNQEKEKNQKILANAEKMIDESIRTIKEISNNLSPHVLNNFGLEKALKSFIVNLQIMDKPKIHLQSNIGQQRFSFNIETITYRVICELITNTVKHAEAGNIYIDINTSNGYLLIQYVDDGKGFDWDQAYNEQKGLGLTNIDSRIKSLHGDMDFFTRPGAGIRVNIRINKE